MPRQDLQLVPVEVARAMRRGAILASAGTRYGLTYGIPWFDVEVIEHRS